MSNKIINPKSIPYLEKFFDTHKLFYVTDFPWQFFNAETSNAFSTIDNTSTNQSESIWNPDNNIKIRYKWLCEEYGLFNTMAKEKNNLFRILEYAFNKDNPYTIRQRRYLTQQLIEFDGVMNNPIHFSIKPKKDKVTFDLDGIGSCKNFEMVCHPGATRGAAHAFLRSNSKKLFLYINKVHYSNMTLNMNDNITEIKDFNNLVDYFTTNFETDEDLVYNFTSEGPDDSYKNNMKYHTQTECNVLKCFEIKKVDFGGEIIRDKKQKFLKTETFQSDAFSDNYNISNILTNAPLTVYSNDEEKGRVESYLLKNRNKLLDKNFKDRHGVHSPVDLVAIRDYMYAHRPKFHNESEEILYGKIEEFFGKLRDLDDDVLKNNLFDEYRFEVRDRYFEHWDGQKLEYQKIAEKNNFKGFAIWIDKSIISTFDRDPYEFLYLVRNDIALTKTEDDKVAIINCEHEDWKKIHFATPNIWILNDEFPRTEIQGNYVDWHWNGKKRQEGNFDKNNKKDGEWTSYWRDGSIKEIKNWKHGLPCGKHTIFWENGQKYKERNFSIFNDRDSSGEGLLQGLMTMWYEDGQIMREQNYQKNQWNGRETTWYQNGKKKYEGWHEKNLKVGEWYAWDEDGNLLSKKVYDKGEIDTR
jgi:antitoxin component YwqK of YwqJK toxin-antitoxin module